MTKQVETEDPQKTKKSEIRGILLSFNLKSDLLFSFQTLSSIHLLRHKMWHHLDYVLQYCTANVRSHL